MIIKINEAVPAMKEQSPWNSPVIECFQDRKIMTDAFYNVLSIEDHKCWIFVRKLIYVYTKKNRIVLSSTFKSLKSYSSGGYEGKRVHSSI